MDTYSCQPHAFSILSWLMSRRAVGLFTDLSVNVPAHLELVLVPHALYLLSILLRSPGLRRRNLLRVDDDHDVLAITGKRVRALGRKTVKCQCTWR